MSQSEHEKAASGKRPQTIAAPGFALAESMGCGQIFGWHRDAGGYAGMIGNAAVFLTQSGDRILYESDRAIGTARVASYLGLDEDIGAIRREIARDGFMRAVVGAVRGLRILKQDPWPCLCSYILSANNRVDRIDKLVKELAAVFGGPHEVAGRMVHSLPEPRDLAACAEAGVRACGVGFRAPYLIGAATMLARGEVDLEGVRALGEEEGREVLKRLPGVGDKVADCVQLFAFSKLRVFPVDVWIKRVMERVYFHSCETSPAEIRVFAQAYFGRYAGYAQEYMYAYARRFGLDW
jgi:N-glycosylase/DNA lyase